jgi:hypothetical protein
MIFMCSTENKYIKLIQFVRLHAYLCIVDEFIVNTDECENIQSWFGIFYFILFLIIHLALFTMCLIFRSINTLFTPKFTINYQ